MRFLDVGCGYDKPGAGIFRGRGDLDVVTLDIDLANKPDVVHDITKPLPEELVGAFDIVLASHVLEHIKYRYVIHAAKHIVSAAKPGGEVWIYVPSMTWAAKEILAGRETFGLMGVIWGGHIDDYDYHYCGFTCNSLGVLMQQSGCKDVRVAEQKIGIVIDNKEYPCAQVSAMGIRV